MPLPVPQSVLASGQQQCPALAQSNVVTTRFDSCRGGQRRMAPQSPLCVQITSEIRGRL